MARTLIFYLIVFSMSLFFFDCTSRLKRKHNGKMTNKCMLATIFSFLPVFLLIALRDHVGADYDEYAYTFQSVANGELYNIYYRGKTFTYFEKILSFFIGDNYYLFFAICAFLSLWAVYYAILSASEKPTFSYYIYFSFTLLLQLMNQFRQGLAMAIVMVALSFLIRKKKKIFIVFALLAAAIHPSAIVCIVIVFLGKIPINRNVITMYFVIAGLTVAFFPLITKLLAYTKYGQTYLSWEKYNQSGLPSTLFNLAVRLIFIIIALLVKDKVIKDYQYSIYLYHMALINLVIQCCTTQLYILGRVSTYFYLSYIFLFPIVFPYISRKFSLSYRNFLKPIVFLGFFVYFIVYYFSASGAIGSGYDIYKSLLF